MTVPFFNGERTPNLPNAKGVVLGLDGRNANPSNLLRSAIEGATYALRFGFDEMKALGISANEIVLTGGGTNSATWRQVVADVFDAPVTVLKNNEGAALGAALQGLAMLEGDTVDFPSLVSKNLERSEEHCAEPRSPAVNFYNDSYGEYQQAVERIAQLYG